MADLFIANVEAVREDGTLDLRRGVNADDELLEAVPYGGRDALPGDTVVVASIRGQYQAIVRCGPPRAAFSALTLSAQAPPTGQGWDEVAVFARPDGHGGLEGWLLL